MHSPFHYILQFYLDACFASFDPGAYVRSELEQLAHGNRRLAGLMLAAGTLLLLPPVLVALSTFVAYALGVSWLCGCPTSLCLMGALVAWMVAQLLLVGLLVLLCSLHMEWEPLGFVLALAERLHTTPGVLQNIWRVMVILPALILVVFRYFPFLVF